MSPYPLAALQELAALEVVALERRMAVRGILVSDDVRTLVLRVVGNVRATSDALLSLSDALVELADVHDAAGIPLHAAGCRDLAALVADHAPNRAT